MLNKRDVTHEQMKMMIQSHQLFIESGGTSGERADLSGLRINDYDFSGLDLSGVTGARASTFDHCRFVGCDLYGLSFSNSSAQSADFSDAVMVKAEFYNADFSAARFDRANMVQAEFINTRLRHASFRNTRLRAAIITNCDLTYADLVAVDMQQAAVTDNVGLSRELVYDR